MSMAESLKHMHLLVDLVCAKYKEQYVDIDSEEKIEDMQMHTSPAQGTSLFLFYRNS
jgi:hypothetical protein